MRIRTECPSCGEDDLKNAPDNAIGNARKRCIACGCTFVEKVTNPPTKAELKRQKEVERQQKALKKIPSPSRWEMANLI
jgi:transposase-like protein